MSGVSVTIVRGEKYIINFPAGGGKSITLTHEEWMALRRAQSALIYTEPKPPVALKAWATNKL